MRHTRRPILYSRLKGSWKFTYKELAKDSSEVRMVMAMVERLHDRGWSSEVLRSGLMVEGPVLIHISSDDSGRGELGYMFDVSQYKTVDEAWKALEPIAERLEKENPLDVSDEVMTRGSDAPLVSLAGITKLPKEAGAMVKAVVDYLASRKWKLRYREGVGFSATVDKVAGQRDCDRTVIKKAEQQKPDQGSIYRNAPHVEDYVWASEVHPRWDDLTDDQQIVLAQNTQLVFGERDKDGLREAVADLLLTYGEQGSIAHAATMARRALIPSMDIGAGDPAETIEKLLASITRIERERRSSIPVEPKVGFIIGNRFPKRETALEIFFQRKWRGFELSADSLDGSNRIVEELDMVVINNRALEEFKAKSPESYSRLASFFKAMKLSGKPVIDYTAIEADELLELIKAIESSKAFKLRAELDEKLRKLYQVFIRREEKKMKSTTRKYYYAGIGTREAVSPAMTAFMKEIAKLLAERGWVLRSGAAQGCDTIFEEGHGDGEKEIFLPWPGFNGHKSKLHPPFKGEAYEVAKKFHPAWDRLSPAARKLMARNSFQVLGWDLETPTDVVIAHSKDGKGGGGTGQALRIAQAYKIPMIDLANYEGRFDEARTKILEMIDKVDGGTSNDIKVDEKIDETVIENFSRLHEQLFVAEMSEEQAAEVVSKYTKLTAEDVPVAEAVKKEGSLERVIVNLFKAVFGRYTSREKLEKKDEEIETKDVLPCLAKVWVDRSGDMKVSTRVQPGDYREELPAIDNTLMGKLIKGYGGEPSWVYLSLTEQLSEQGVRKFAREVLGLGELKMEEKEYSVILKSSGYTVARKVRGGKWMLDIQGIDDRLGLIHKRAVELVRGKGIHAEAIPVPESWLKMDKGGLRRRVVIDNGVFKAIMTRHLGEEKYIKSLRRMPKDLCNFIEDGKFAKIRLLVIDRETDGHIHMIGSPERAGKSALIRGLNMLKPTHLLKARCLFSATREEIEDIVRLERGTLERHNVHGVATPDEIKWTDAEVGKVYELLAGIAVEEGDHKSHEEPAARVHEFDVEAFPDAWEPSSLAKIERKLGRGLDKVDEIISSNYHKLLFSPDQETEEDILDQNIARFLLGRGDYAKEEPLYKAISRRVKSAKWDNGANAEVVFAPFWGDYDLQPGEVVLSAALAEAWDKAGRPETVAITRWPKVSTQSTGMVHVATRDGMPVINGRYGLFVVAHPGIAPYIQGDDDDHIQIFWDLKARHVYRDMILDGVEPYVPGEGRRGPEDSDPYIAMISGITTNKKTGLVMSYLTQVLSAINQNLEGDLRQEWTEKAYKSLGIDLQSTVQGAKKPVDLLPLEDLQQIAERMIKAVQKCGHKINPLSGIGRGVLNDKDFEERGIRFKTPTAEYNWNEIHPRIVQFIRENGLPIDIEEVEKVSKRASGVKAHAEILENLKTKHGLDTDFALKFLTAMENAEEGELELEYEDILPLIHFGAEYTLFLSQRRMDPVESLRWLDGVVYMMLRLIDANVAEE